MTGVLRAMLSLAATLAVVETAGAQPSDLFACTSSEGYTCAEIAGGAVSTACGRLFDLFYGRIAFYPLRCVGPITISIENVAIYQTQYPLYVEVVPYLVPEAQCISDPGYQVFTVHGIEADCGGWETSAPIDITNLVPIGDLYGLRLQFFVSPYAFSPAIDCVRVTAHPITSALQTKTWAKVKTLYR